MCAGMGVAEIRRWKQFEKENGEQQARWPAPNSGQDHAAGWPAPKVVKPNLSRTKIQTRPCYRGRPLSRATARERDPQTIRGSGSEAWITFQRLLSSIAEWK